MNKNMKLYLPAILITALFLAVSTSAFAQTDDSADLGEPFTINGADVITENAIPLNLKALYGGLNVTSVAKWSVLNGCQFATIDLSGTVTPLDNGCITVMAVYTPENQSDAVCAYKTITISNQSQTPSRVYLSVTAESSGHIVRITGPGTNDRENWYSGRTGSDCVVGTTYVFTAKETNCKFLYWKDVGSGRIITTDKTYSFTLGTDTIITAVFSTSEADKNLVLFKNNNGHIVDSGYYKAPQLITVPQKPTTPGYSFKAWLLDGEEQQLKQGGTIDASTIDGDRIYTAGYTVRDTRYNVTVTGGSGSGSYRYNDRVWVTLDQEAVPPGKQFAYWAKNGSVASYDKSYSFCVGTDTTIDAVYANAAVPVEKSPAISISIAATSVVERKITFLSERTMPLDYEFVEAGILMTSTTPRPGATSFQHLNLSTSGAIRIVAISDEGNGQFCVRKKEVNQNTTWYARAYMIYKKDGIAYTIYSDTISARL